MKAKILVVDDEPDVLHLVEYNLTAANYQVITAADGVDALKKARASLPNLIILDLMLPELDGLALLRLVREDSEVPVLVLSARGSAADRGGLRAAPECLPATAPRPRRARPAPAPAAQRLPRSDQLVRTIERNHCLRRRVVALGDLLQHVAIPHEL